MKLSFTDIKLFLFLASFSIFLFLFDKLGILYFPKLLIQSATVPVQYGLYKSGMAFSQQFEFIVMVRQASLENKALKKQLGDLLVENSEVRRKLAENELLLEQYNKLNPRTYDMVATRPIGSGRYLTIDKGYQDGILGDQAVVYKDSLIGQVRNVNPKSAVVMFPSDPDSKIAAYSQNTAGRAKGILKGQFGSEILMDKILHEEAVEVGDLVYTEGTEGKLPKGLIVGRVSEVLERPNEVFKQAKVKAVYDFSDLDMMFVIRNP